MRIVFRRWAFRFIGTGLSLTGLAALAMAAMLAVPLHQPQELKSITAGVHRVDRSDLPELRRFQARDGSELAYRLYEPAEARESRTAVLIHGSAGSSVNMHAVGRALAAAGIKAVAVDIRGHGRSGTRGDIGYLGQLDDDLADTVRYLRQSWPDAAFTLIGHSAGGGFALRTAGSTNGNLFTSYVLLAPYLDYSAPTSRTNSGSAHWAEADIPRILGLSLLRRMGIGCCDALPVLAFALPPESTMRATPRYSYRLFANFGTGLHYRQYLSAARRPITVICGSDDELMDASRYEDAMRGGGQEVHALIVPGVDHMGILSAPPALSAIVASVGE
jgi:pimeloyl-ACP methyl ester carboxylesterase